MLLLMEVFVNLSVNNDNYNSRGIFNQQFTCLYTSFIRSLLRLPWDLVNTLAITPLYIISELSHLKYSNMSRQQVSAILSKRATMESPGMCKFEIFQTRANPRYSGGTRVRNIPRWTTCPNRATYRRDSAVNLYLVKFPRVRYIRFSSSTITHRANDNYSSSIDRSMLRLTRGIV